MNINTCERAEIVPCNNLFSKKQRIVISVLVLRKTKLELLFCIFISYY